MPSLIQHPAQHVAQQTTQQTTLQAAQQSIQLAAQLLTERRIAGVKGSRLPEHCRPLDIPSALAIQAAVTELWCDQMDDSVGGWKCGLPAPDKIVVAPIYTRTIDSVPPVAVWSDNHKARIEPELAFIFGADLPARATPYTPAEVDAVIVRTHLALELINSRYAEPKSCSFPEMLADGLVNQGLFIGSEVDTELARLASEFIITVNCANGESLEYQGRHPNNNPRAPLYWLVEFLRAQGQSIVAGQAIITGSFAGVIEVPLDTDIQINYAGLGNMQAHFKAKE